MAPRTSPCPWYTLFLRLKVRKEEKICSLEKNTQQLEEKKPNFRSLFIAWGGVGGFWAKDDEI